MTTNLANIIGSAGHEAAYEWCAHAARSLLPGVGVDVVLVGVGLAYAWSIVRGRYDVKRSQAACFATGLGVLALTLSGPVERVALERLFTAYIFQQFAMVMVAAPLLLMGLPAAMARRVFLNPVIGPIWRLVTKPVVAIIIFGAVFAIIHYPSICDRVCHMHTTYYGIRTLLVVVGLVLWWPLLSPVQELPRASYPVQILYLFLVGIAMTATAAPITMARSVLYSFYVPGPHPFGLSPIDDQIIGGLLMWVGQALYLIAIATVIFFRWVQSEANPNSLSVPASLQPR